MGVWWMARTLPLPSSSPSLVRISAAVSASRKPKRSSSAAEVKPAVCVAVAAAAPPVAPPVRVVWPPVWAEGVCVAVWKLRLVMAGGGALDGRRGPGAAGVAAPCWRLQFMNAEEHSASSPAPSKTRLLGLRSGQWETRLGLSG